MFRYLHLGMQPLANAFRDPATSLSDELRVPLVLQACPGCRLSQLTHTVPKETLYTTYAYSSGINVGWHTHCEQLALAFGRSGAFVIDIAANDGTLVRKFAALGCDTVGVEPSQSFDGYNKITGWWSTGLVQKLALAERADVVVAQNVLGHVDNVHDFMDAIQLALAPDGVAVIEVPWVCELLERTAFDTVYHEHLSYWSLTALVTLAQYYKLTVTHVDRLDVHGGSIRVQLRKSGRASDEVTAMLVHEQHTLRRPAYLAFSARATRLMAAINTTLHEAGDYVAYGAAAKATVLLNTLDVRALPAAIYDDTPAKQGRCVPGTRIPVEASPPWRFVQQPIAVLPWNWAPEIIARLRDAGCRAPIFVPLPKPHWDTVQ